jgi:hypothetical protein
MRHIVLRQEFNGLREVQDYDTCSSSTTRKRSYVLTDREPNKTAANYLPKSPLHEYVESETKRVPTTVRYILL